MLKPVFVVSKHGLSLGMEWCFFELCNRSLIGRPGKAGGLKEAVQ